MVSTDSAKKELSETDGLGPRYKQPCGVGDHVDISTQRQEGVNSVFLKVLEGAVNLEQALVRAFSVIVKSSRTFI